MICRWCREEIVKRRPLIDAPEMWMASGGPVWYCQGSEHRHSHQPLTLGMVMCEIAVLL